MEDVSKNSAQTNSSDVNSLIDAAIAKYKKNAVGSIGVRMVGNEKCLALISNDGNVVSSIPISDLGNLVDEPVAENAGSAIDPVTAPFVVATWNTGRWSLGKNQLSSIWDSTADDMAAKIKKAMRKANGGELPDVFFTQETNEDFICFKSGTTDSMIFDEYENKIHPFGSSTYVYGRSRNCIYTKSMTEIDEGKSVETFKNPSNNVMGYYTISLATISGKQVALVCTHFGTVDPSGASSKQKASAKAQQNVAKKMISDLAKYPYVIIGGDFNAMEFTLMPDSDDPYGDLTPKETSWDMRAYYPCGFAAAGYHCASGPVGTYNKLINSKTGVKKDLLINGSGTSYRIVDNILVKGLTISDVGRVNVGKGDNDVDDNTQLSDHSILYCTVKFED